MYAPVATHPALRFAALCHGGPECGQVALVAERMPRFLKRDPRDRRVLDSPWG